MSTGMIVSREEAKASGRTRYFDGEPCKHGHICERYTLQGQCVECNNAAFRAYRIANIKKERKRRADYYEENKEKDRAFYAANSKEIRQKQMVYYGNNRAKIRARARSIRAINLPISREKERLARIKNRKSVKASNKAWEQANPDKVRAKKHRRRARLKSAQGHFTASDVRDLYAKQKGRCAICFRRLHGKYCTDHVVSLSRGGSNHISNIQLTCKPCNSRKWAKDPFVFANELGRLL